MNPSSVALFEPSCATSEMGKAWITATPSEYIKAALNWNTSPSSELLSYYLNTRNPDRRAIAFTDVNSTNAYLNMLHSRSDIEHGEDGRYFTVDNGSRTVEVINGIHTMTDQGLIRAYGMPSSFRHSDLPSTDVRDVTDRLNDEGSVVVASSPLSQKAGGLQHEDLEKLIGEERIHYVEVNASSVLWDGAMRREWMPSRLQEYHVPQLGSSNVKHPKHMFSWGTYIDTSDTGSVFEALKNRNVKGYRRSFTGALLNSIRMLSTREDPIRFARILGK